MTNALNMPSLSAEEAPRLKPYMALAEKLGSLVGQLATAAIAGLSIEAEGAAAELNHEADHRRRAGRAACACYSDTVNMVNAPFLAKERGLDVREVRHDREGDYHTLLRVTAETTGRPAHASPARCSAMPRRGWSSCSGSRSRPTSPAHMLYIVNEDAPGFIGRLGTTLGEAGINIGTFHLGRREAGGEAVLLLSVDEPRRCRGRCDGRGLPGCRLVKRAAVLIGRRPPAVTGRFGVWPVGAPWLLTSGN